MTIQEIHSYLKSHDIRPLPHKVVIMQYLRINNIHPTIEQIYNDLLPIMPTLSKTTVYNTLKLFNEKKVVNVLYIDEKQVRFDGHTEVIHAHFRCKKCGTIFNVPIEESEIAPFRGAKTLYPDETHVYFFGLCDDCIEHPV